MTVSLEEIYETASMILYQNLDIRTTTLGVNLKDCVDSDFEKFKENVYTRIRSLAVRLVAEAKKLERKYGVPIDERYVWD